MLNELKKLVDENIIKEKVSMAEITTFKTGGIADMIVYPNNIDELKTVVEFFHEYKSEYYVLGNGSNLLVSDKGIRKPIICLGHNFASINVFDNCITASSGALLSAIARKAADEALTGFEFAAGIPGTLGGALMMNAGAYGGEMKDVVEAVSFMDSTGQQYVVSGEEMEFGYRKSALSDTDCIITGATIKLDYGDRGTIIEKMNELAAKRREKQPLEHPSAGSTFKRPQGYFAGTLIEGCNLKGTSLGGAQVSEKHAGFIINKGNATTEDVCRLIELVKNTVFKAHGVELEPEVKYWD